MNGISADKREGIRRLRPELYSFTMAFGMKDNPGSILPSYHKVVNGDHFVDDSGSRYYNRLVNESQVQKDMEFFGEPDTPGTALQLRPGSEL